MKFSVSEVLCLFALLTTCASESYWQLQLSPESIGSVPFGSSHISVWEHATWKGRYFAMPLVCLQSGTAEVVENIFSRRIELEFSVLLWSREARKTVSNFLRTHINASIVEEQVELLPMEKIRLVWRGPQLPDYYQLADQWRSNTHLPTLVTFSVTCQDSQRCRELRDAVKTRPNTFKDLELEYEISSQRSARRRLTVEGRHLVGGSLYASLESMPVSSPIRYLRSEDVKRLTTETLTNVISSQVTDQDYVDTDDEISMAELLQRVFDQTKVTTADFQPAMWQSVFWNPDNTRPDKIKSYMNKVISKNATNSRYLSIDQSQRSRSVEASFGFLGLFHTGGGGGSTSRSSVQKENLLQALRERDSGVQWTGERFIPKPVQLSRLNLATLNTSTNIVTSFVQIKRHDSVQRIKLRVSCDNNQTSRLTPELVRVGTFVNNTEFEQNKTGALHTRLDKLEVAQQTRIELETLNTILSDRRSLPLQGYCYKPGHYCEHRPASSAYHERMTLQALKTLCDQNTTCKAFNDYTRAVDGGGRVYQEVCPAGQFSNSSSEHYYVKIASTWGTVISERLSNIVQSTSGNGTNSSFLNFLSLYDHDEYCKQFGDDFQYER